MNRKQPAHQPNESISDVKHVLVWNRPKPTLSELRQTETLPYVNRYFEKMTYCSNCVLPEVLHIRDGLVEDVLFSSLLLDL